MALDNVLREAYVSLLVPILLQQLALDLGEGSVSSAHFQYTTFSIMI